MYRYNEHKYRYSIDTESLSIDTRLGSSYVLAETLMSIDTEVNVSIQLTEYRYSDYSIDTGSHNGYIFKLCIDTNGNVSIHKHREQRETTS